MKILFVTDTYWPHVNGTAIFAYRLAQMMSKAGHEVRVLAPSTKFGHELTRHEPNVEVFGMPSFPVFNYPHFRMTTIAFSKRKIRKYVEAVKPDVIHLQQHFVIGKEVRKIARKQGIPVIGTNHFLPENLLPFFPKFSRNWARKWGWKQFLSVCADVAIMTTPTATAASIIEQIGFTSKVIPVSNGIDLFVFKPTNKGEYLRKKYNIPKKKTILYVGRLDREKRVELLIKALALVRKKVDAQLLIVGPGTKEAEIRNTAKTLGLSKHVVFTGYVEDEDMPNIFKLGDVYANAGIAELQCIAAMEAMATGLPVVAADYKALPELVHHGVNGYLFHDSYTDIAKYLTAILTNSKLKAAMGTQSLKIIAEHSVEKTVKTYEMLYDRAILLQRELEAKRVVPSTLKMVLVPTLVTATIVMAVGGVLAFNSASEIKAAPRDLITKGINTVRTGFDRVESKIEEIKGN